MLACTIFGHRYRFRAEGSTMLWDCERCGEPGGSKLYNSPAEALQFARAFDREDRDDIGRRAPFLGMFPLRIWRALRQRHR